MHDEEGATAVMALEVVPPGSEPVGVEVEAVDAMGRAALRVVLDAARRGGRLGTDFGDEPTFLLLPVSIGDGTIEVDLLSRLLPDARIMPAASSGSPIGCRAPGTPTSRCISGR